MRDCPYMYSGRASMLSISKPAEFSAHYYNAPLTISRCSFFTSLESWSVLDWTSSMGDCMGMVREGEGEGEDWRRRNWDTEDDERREMETKVGLIQQLWIQDGELHVTLMHSVRLRWCVATITGYNANLTRSVKLIPGQEDRSPIHSNLWLRPQSSNKLQLSVALLSLLVGWLGRRSLVATSRTSVPLARDQFYLTWSDWRNTQWLLPHISYM